MLRDVDLMSVDGLRVGQKKGTECHPGSEQKQGLVGRVNWEAGRAILTEESHE